MWVVRVLHKTVWLAIMACYAALACFVIYFPIVYLGEMAIYPPWKWSPLIKHMTMQDSLPFLFLIAILCAAMQSVDAYFRRRLLNEGRKR